jgi:uncharacterized protein with HEPN domain
MRGYEIMGEATRQLPTVAKEANSDIPRVYRAAIRNRIAHGYFGLDDHSLFETIESQLKSLRPRLDDVVSQG